LRQRKDEYREKGYSTSDMDARLFSPNLSVAETLRKGRPASKVFIEHKTACVGCYLMQFCTLEDVAKTYGLAMDDLLNDLQEAVQTNQSNSTRSKNETTA
jgi:hypothetical protein